MSYIDNKYTYCILS